MTTGTQQQPASTRYDVESIKRANPIEDVIERDLGVSGKRQNNLLVWCCPFHQETGPSFTAYPDGHAHCFGCGKHIQDVIAWVREYHNLSFSEACERLGGRVDTAPRRHIRERPPVSEGTPYAAIRPTPSTGPEIPDEAWQVSAMAVVAECELALWDENAPASELARNYLHRRGLGDEILQLFSVGYNPQERVMYGMKVARGIVLPCFHPRLGILFGLNVRQPPPRKPKYVKPVGSKGAPFGVESLTNKSVAFVLEGEFDTLLVLQTLAEMGDPVRHVGAFTMGGASARSVSDWLTLTPELLDPSLFLVTMDCDEAGLKAARFWLGTNKKSRLWPAPTSQPVGDRTERTDVTDLWRMAGDEGLRQWVRSALEHYPIAAPKHLGPVVI